MWRSSDSSAERSSSALWHLVPVMAPETIEHFGDYELVDDADFGIDKATNLPGSIQRGALKGEVPYIN